MAKKTIKKATAKNKRKSKKKTNYSKVVNKALIGLEKKPGKKSKKKPRKKLNETHLETKIPLYRKIYLKLFGSRTKKWIQTIDKRVDFKKTRTGQDKTKQSTNFNKKLPKWLRILLFPIINPIARYALLTVFGFMLLGIAYLVRDLPSPAKLTSKENFSVSTQIFDRNGVLLYEIFAEENRIPINLEDLPDHVIQATISTEDQNFYRHFGIDIGGIIRAARNNLINDRLEGGSTITQQLVKNALLTPERSLTRKVKEAVLAVMTEILYSKDEILEMYLNYISYGGTSVGIEAAANKYFDKHAKDLTLAEASVLAGLPQAPSLYSPFGSDPERARDRQIEVLNRMIKEKYITSLEAEEAKATTLEFALKRTDIRAPHFVFYVRDLLYQEYGEETVEKGGLRVTTTLDIDLQESAQASLSAEIDSLERLRVGNGAAMVTKPNTGEILAMIGSRDYFNTEEDGQVNVTLAHRQPGSSIKPLVYATTFQEKTLNPGSILLDIPTCFKLPNQKDYCPRNYSGDFKGPVTVRRALGNSLNITAVKAISTISVTNFINQAEKMGITGWDDPANYGPSLALGGGEVRMFDMTVAFGSLANQGVKVPIDPILKIENYKGELITEHPVEERLADLEEMVEYDSQNGNNGLKRVLDRAPAYLVSHIMQDNNARIEAFGARSDLVIPGQVVSAKTGTTNDLKDNWTIGFTPEFLTVTWVGNNDNTRMSYVASGVTGASPIFNDIMSYVLRNEEPLWQEKPADVLKAHLCASGMPPELSYVSDATDENANQNGGCSPTDEDLFWKEGIPSKSTKFTKEIWLKPETGLPPEFGEEAEGLVLETKTIYTDPVTRQYCLDCARPVDEEGKIQYEKHYVEPW